MTVGIKTSDSDLPVNADFQPNKMLKNDTTLFSNTLQKRQKAAFIIIFIRN